MSDNKFQVNNFIFNQIEGIVMFAGISKVALCIAAVGGVIAVADTETSAGPFCGYEFAALLSGIWFLF